MERPEQHITETKSKRIFEEIVPADWVTREIKPDYGIDYLIEIFQNNQSTGQTFFVQLKGSLQEIIDDTFEKQFTVDNLNYYSSLSLPVFIICVSVNTSQIWGIWANKLIESREIKSNQSSLLIKLNREYLLNAEKFKRIASDLDNATKLGFSSKCDSSITYALNEKINQWINGYYSNSVASKFNYLPNHLTLIYSTYEKSIIQLDIKTYGFSKSIQISGLQEDDPFLLKPLFDDTDINEFNKNVLLSIAIALAKYDIKGSLKIIEKIIDKINFMNTNDLIQLDPLGMLKLAISKNELALFDRLVNKMIEIQQFEIFFLFDLAYFVLGQPELRDYRTKNLLYIIENYEDPHLLATCHYNIGNILRSQSKEAIPHYMKARKLNPDYLERDYWWREIAGLLFSKRHYNWAEYCYKKSLNTSPNIGMGKSYNRIVSETPDEKYLVNAMIADCLFFQGKFSQAKILFEKYFKTVNVTSQEWILKNMVCEELINKKLDDIKFDISGSTKECQVAMDSIPIDNAIKKLKKAIQLNPLNGLAWFNLGVALNKDGKLEEAMFSFVMTGLVQEFDKEAQFNALSLAMTINDYEMIQTLLLFIFEKHGELVMNDLSIYIGNKNIPLEEKKDLIKVLTEMLELIKSTHINKIKMIRFNPDASE